MERFFHTKARKSQMGEVSPLSDGAEMSSNSSRIERYSDDRNRSDLDTSSKLRCAKVLATITNVNGMKRISISPYLASGVISARECIRQAMKLQNKNKLEASRGDGVGMWIQEVGTY